MNANLVKIINFLNKNKIKYNLIDEDDQVRFEIKNLDCEYIVVSGNDVHINNIDNITENQLNIYLDRVKYINDIK